ncbi:nucleotidyltransferase family protein [Aestuariibaculum sp. YM273]|uniref:nucleotidyltransferase family protein n=1 Tax=Aestuariibaculum sp. YM273 TaxID=3070659 RepID=UPI0027DC61F4|nr:nucleotidyltransferase family protein [Aestuariibaculum sp. YM273]WMI65428.1 nucleotidyltransferase family protein [Aestuariibaculum sp. YM273]
MNPSSQIAMVILAAGASKRMGEPKQLLLWGDSTLLEHSIETALDVSANHVYLVLGANYKTLKSKIESRPVEIIYNPDWEKGLGKSISKAVTHLKNSNLKFDGVLFLLADQPFITSDYLEQMIGAFKPKKEQIIATSYVDGENGVPVLFDAVYFTELEALNEDKGAKQILKHHKQKVEILFSGTKNIDLDTQTEYVHAYQAKFKK